MWPGTKPRRSSPRESTRARKLTLGALGLATLVALSLAAFALVNSRSESSTQGGTAAADAPPTQAPLPTVVFIGDSYSAGVGASSEALRWTDLVSDQLGWREQNEALGGTGYVVTSVKAGCGVDYCPNYRDKINLVQGAAPDIVVLSGGRNDGRTPPGYADAVAGTIQAAQSRWPEATIVLTSPLWDDDPVPSWMPALLQRFMMPQR